ncbi:hypothetical protein HHI36_011405 [Cryptolaemus montrouzieri]|uniref:CHK kinase-like domain-containing protein n=1 Tax=Cryptolaemus montrouzieri TaxID=559131 RepID=A0ABD2MLM9_9CUCU
MSLKELQSLISPKFSTDDLLRIVEVHSDLKNIKLGNIILTPSSQKIGDSYLSNIVRFSIDASGINERGESKSVTVNVITKVWSSVKDFYKSKHLEKEFDEVIPLFLTHYIGGYDDFICLEDLSYKNYRSMERGDGINQFYTIQVLDLFAKFHALSLAFKDQKPEMFAEIAGSLKETYFSEKYFSWYGKLQESLLIFKNDFFKKTCDICERKRCHLSGITQGDAWLPNFLFRQDGKDQLSVVMIDFQLARWAPFSNDISFFLLTCVEENTLIKCWDEFINEYAIRMKKYLTVLGSSSDLFNVEEFYKDLRSNLVFNIAMVIEALPMSLLDGFDLDVIQGNEEVPLESVWVIHPFEDEKRRRRVANVIKLIIDKLWV